MDLTVKGWKLHYRDCCFTSKDGTWEQAPPDGVLALVVYYEQTYQIWRDGKLVTEPYRHLLCGLDYYWQFGNGQAEQVPEGVDVKLGIEVSNQEWVDKYNKIYQEYQF